MLTHMQTFETRASLMGAVAADLGRIIGAAIANHGDACVALSGGATPAPAYERLAALPLDWPKVTFALVDERFVPPHDPDSNEGLLRRALAHALAKGARLLPMYAAAAALDEAAARADALYAPLRIDTALMGMGEDGHTASWFAGAPRLSEALDLANLRTVVALRTPSAAGSSARLTLTRSAIARSGAVLLVITGVGKRGRLEEAVTQPPELAPVSALFLAGPPPRVMWAP